MSQFHFKFIYQESGVKNDSLTLLKFSGQETISSLFNFELELKSSDINLDGDSILNQACSIEIYYGDQAKPIRIIHGLINEFEDINYLPDSTLYRANVVPRIWQLGLFETNEVYLNESIQDTLTVILEEADFIQGQDFRFELARTYRKWPFRLQYNETHLAYLQRIIEREGIYYYFEQSDSGEVLVFCDNNQALPSISQAQSTTRVVFQPSSGLNVVSQANTINSIICKRQTLPKKVTLRDFNDETPSLDIRGTHVINSTGMGEINLYGLNITSPEEGQQLAEIHANAYLSRQKSYICQGDVATMTMGHTFTLSDHPRDNFNQLTYLLESIHHEGTNVNEYKEQQLQDNAIVNYSNTLTALSTEHEFAPKRQTLAPEINGTLNAVIDAEAADSSYAELDESGRYKVKLPFDRKDRDGGKASHWVRMMQPYGGANEGMHFPLRNGTRVLLGFIGGDPDRPFISGTINDSGEQQSIVTAENQSNNLIKTASGNKIELEDKEGKNRIKLQTGDDKTYMHLGAPNHDGSGFVMVTGGIERRDISGGQRVTVTTSSESNDDTATISAFDNTSAYVKGDIVTYEGKSYSCKRVIVANSALTQNAIPDSKSNFWDEYIRDTSLFKFHKMGTNGKPSNALTKSQEVSGEYIIQRLSGNQYSWNKGNQFNYFETGADKTPSSDNKHFYFGNNWEVHCSRHAADPANLITTMEKFNLLGVLDYENNEVDWPDTLKKGRVRVAHHDTFNSQNGNIFDFGGYWNYNLGNSYTENTISQAHTKVNRKDLPYDWCDIGGPHWTALSPKKDRIVSTTLFEQFGEPDYLTDFKDSTNVEKTIDGHAYDYSHNTHSIEVSHKCNSIEVSVGGKSREVKFNGKGYKTYESKSEGGISEEWKSTPTGSRTEYEKVDMAEGGAPGKVTETRVSTWGNPTSYEIIREPAPGTKFSFKGDGLPTLEMKMEIDVGSTVMSTHIGVMDNLMHLEAMGMSNSLKIDGTLMSNSIVISSTILENEVKTGLGGLEKCQSSFMGGDAQHSGKMAEIRSKNAVELVKKNMKIQKELMELKSKELEVGSSKARLLSSIITLLS